MLIQNKRIAIVGGGPGGLTLARLLQLKGADVKVYERDIHKDTRVQGSPLDLHDESGLAALRKADLLTEFKNNFMAGADKMRIVNKDAEILFSDHESKSEENFGNPHFRPEIDRGALRNILMDSLAPGTIQWNTQFISMEKQNNGWLLQFKNQEAAYADLVIAADGANSKIRPYLRAVKPFFSGILMLEGNIYAASKTSPKISELLGGGKIMAFGNKQNLLMGQKANDTIGFYASFKADENWAAISGLNFSARTELLAWFKKEYSGWNPVWNELFENAELPLFPRPIYAMPLDQTWASTANLTLIGDAAHVMPPFAGEGVNMAMLDALELSECLCSGQFPTLREAISSYEKNMLSRASAATRESLENGERMHSEIALDTMLSFFNGH